jgi:beta-N-acetylhexosaminidase
MSLGPLMIGIEGESLRREEREWLTHPAVCGVILFSRNFTSRGQLCELVANIRAIRSPELLVAVDQEGGRVQRFKDPFTVLPAMREIGQLCSSDTDRAEDAAEKIGWLMAAELRACGVDMSFAPVVDLDRGVASVIGDRAFHTDAETVSALAIAFMRGMRRAGMAATAKHFPSHAGALIDSHEALAVDRRDYSELYDDLIPYQRMISAGLNAVMVSHVVFPALDERPASLSHWWITEQLRQDLRFSGAIISDDLGMGGVESAGPMPERMQAALQAGCDMALICNDLSEVSAMLDQLESWNDPAAQLRLMRLRGGASPDWNDLRRSMAWRDARECVLRVCSPPELELRG